MSDALAESRGLLILPRLRVQNANAISSPLTHGFPSITAFLGLMWALERQLAGRYPLFFTGVGVICHHHEELVATAGFTRAFRLTRNPVDKDGSTAAIVEEGRIHLEVTLVFGVSGTVLEGDWSVRRECADYVAEQLAQLRIAGGTVLPSAAAGIRATRPQLEAFPDEASDRQKWFGNLRRRWLPGFALVARDDLLADRLAQLRKKDAAATALDAWLDLSRLNCVPPPRDEAAATDKKLPLSVEWIYEKKPGWLVPIPVGYAALTPLQAGGSVRNARDATTPFRFVESLYSIGQWIAPHRLDSWRQLLWYGHSDIEAGRYRACNHYIAATSTHPH